MGNAPTKGLQHKNRGHKKYVHWDQAVPPWPPGKPHLVPGSPNTQPDVVTIRWDPPPDDGGAPITGYVVEHRKTGTPHWVRSTTDLVLEPELRLSGLEPGWRYQFRVTAENAADLLSDPGELSQPLTVARAYRPATMAPQFSLDLRDTTALENEKAEFLVHYHGIPTPKVSWYKDGFEIFSSRRMRVTVESDRSSLVIFQAAFSDEGEYKCTATNRAGHKISRAKLRLEAPPRIRIPRQYEDGLLFEKDEVIRLKVSVAGRPLPRATWHHDGDLIPFGGRYEVTNTDRFSALRISEARRADRGEYQVRATSRLGEDLVSFLVTVTDRPMPPGRAKVVTIMGRSVTLSWTEPDDDGGCKIGNYIVEYYRLGWNVWLKAATCRQLKTTLGDLIEGSEYKFRVKAENPYGVSDPSLESEVVFIPDPKRGLLERPAGGTGSRSDIPLPDQPTATKREHRRSKDSLVGRETPEVKRRKEVESKEQTPDKESEDRKKLKSELLEKLESKRRTLEREATPEMAKRQKVSEAPQKPPRTDIEKSVKGTLQFSVTKRRGSSGERDSGVSEESYTESKQSFTSPLMPREDDSLLHGSSELMLVLLPHTEQGQGDRDQDRSTDMFGDSAVPPPMSLSAPELGGGESWVTSPLRNAVSSTELLHEQAMARFYQAVAAEEAEKARQRKENLERKSAEPDKIKQTEDIEPKKQQTKTLEPPSKQELTWHQRKQRKLLDRRDSWETATAMKRGSPQPELNLKSILSRKEATKLSTEEEEEAVFDKVRQKIAQPAEEIKPRSILRHREEKEITPPKVEDIVITKEEKEELDDEMQLQLEEDYYHDEELEEEESIEEENSEFDEEEELYKSMEEEEGTYHPDNSHIRHVDRFAEEEEVETYHPRNMTPTAVSVEEHIAKVLERQDTPRPSNEPPSFVPKSILKYNSRFQEQLDAMVERGNGIRLERSPPKSFRESLPKELMPSFISDRSRSPSPQSPAYSPEVPQVEDEEEEEHEMQTRERFEGYEFRHAVRTSEEHDTPKGDQYLSASESMNSSMESAVSTEDLAVSPTQPTFQTPEPVALSPQPSFELEEVVTPPPQSSFKTEEPAPPPVQISPKVEELPAPAEQTISRPATKPPPAEPKISAAESERQKRMLLRRASMEEDREGSRAVADLYGDIIKEYGRPKTPIKRYMNTAEMKAAAYASRRQQRSLPTPEPPPAPTPEPEPEPEPELEALSIEDQTLITEKSAYDRYTAPVQRPTTPRRQSRTPELVLIRQSSRDRSRSRMPSTERFAAELSKQFPDVKRRFSPEPSVEEPVKEKPRPVILLKPEEPPPPQQDMTERKWRSVVGYLADLAMFLVACWLYAFKDERLAIPVLALMVFHQVIEAVRRRIPKMPQLPWRRNTES
ncbi:muscle M-line assembly protein unc-89 [Periplaneta americana]|uniref:muscle M-line assembly protein unc-89 n=1 Tax=Periplaneta americana TaxID=6978 RepID=UPI0037E88C93